MSTTDDRVDALIDHLVTAIRPVRRLRPPAVRLAGWLAVVFAIAASVGAAGLRRDAAVRLASAAFVAELACLGAAAVAAAWIALRGSVPGLDDRRARSVLIAAVIASAVLGLHDMEPSLATPFASFVHRGIPCAAWSMVVGLAPAAVLLATVWRGLPLRSARSFGAAGLAAALAAYALLRVRCSLDETLHIAIWHGGPAVVVTCAAAITGMCVARARRAGRVAA
jgi:hypothetical protein